MERLPQEILDHIVSYLDSEPPSERHLFDRPSSRFFYSDLLPLKWISLTSRRFRKPAAKLLFKHLIMDTSRDTSKLFPILRNLEIGTNQVHSILIHNNPFADRPVSTRQIQRVLDVALEMLNPIVVTLAVSPTQLATLMMSECRLTDAWAFQIPFQVLRLQTDERESYVRQTPSHLMQGRPCHQVTFNEGSTVPIYSTYEYFHRQMPSWMIDPLFFRGCLCQLTVFEFIAVFPHTNLDRLNILSCMTSLRIFRVQLAPSRPHPNPSQDDIKEAHLIQENNKDIWMELGAFLEALAERIENDWSSLPLSTVDFLDYRNDTLKGLDKMIDEAAHDKMVSWTRGGECSWIKNTNNSGPSTESAQA